MPRVIHGTRITPIFSRDADRADLFTGRGSRGSLHATQIALMIAPLVLRQKEVYLLVEAAGE
jgi:hypothetical protein